MLQYVHLIYIFTLQNCYALLLWVNLTFVTFIKSGGRFYLVVHRTVTSKKEIACGAINYADLRPEPAFGRRRRCRIFPLGSHHRSHYEVNHRSHPDIPINAAVPGDVQTINPSLQDRLVLICIVFRFFLIFPNCEI